MVSWALGTSQPAFGTVWFCFGPPVRCIHRYSLVVSWALGASQPSVRFSSVLDVWYGASLGTVWWCLGPSVRHSLRYGLVLFWTSGTAHPSVQLGCVLDPRYVTAFGIRFSSVLDIRYGASLGIVWWCLGPSVRHSLRYGLILFWTPDTVHPSVQFGGVLDPRYVTAFGTV